MICGAAGRGVGERFLLDRFHAYTIDLHDGMFNTRFCRRSPFASGLNTSLRLLNAISRFPPWNHSLIKLYSKPVLFMFAATGETS